MKTASSKHAAVRILTRQRVAVSEDPWFDSLWEKVLSIFQGIETVIENLRVSYKIVNDLGVKPTTDFV
jgi:hypothetical protein